MLFYYMKDYRSAKNYLERAMTIYEKELGTCHPYTKSTKRYLEIVKKKLDE